MVPVQVVAVLVLRMLHVRTRKEQNKEKNEKRIELYKTLSRFLYTRRWAGRFLTGVPSHQMYNR